MSTITPSILVQSFKEFSEKINQLLNFSELTDVQIDFTDSRFTPSSTIAPSEISSLPINYVFSAHLMVTNPASYLPDIEKAGFESVVLHFESFRNPEDLNKTMNDYSEAGIVPFIGITLETKIEEIFPLIKDVNTILLMSSVLGDQDRNFKESTFEKIQFLRDRDYYGMIIIDGGIKKNHIVPLLTSGADSLIVGSAIFDSEDPAQAFKGLLAEAGEKL